MLGAMNIIAAKPGKEFEPFLHAVIQEDPQGPALTVLSALARRDVDPWDEAASLSDLSPADAIVQLVALLHAMPSGQRPPDALVATRLQALLPRPRSATGNALATRMNAAWQPVRPKLREPDGDAQVATRSGFSYLLIYLVFVAILIGSEWLNASGEAPTAANAEHAGMPVATATPVGKVATVVPSVATSSP